RRAIRAVVMTARFAQITGGAHMIRISCQSRSGLDLSMEFLLIAPIRAICIGELMTTGLLTCSVVTHRQHLDWPTLHAVFVSLWQQHRLGPVSWLRHVPAMLRVTRLAMGMVITEAACLIAHLTIAADSSDFSQSIMAVVLTPACWASHRRALRAARR